MSKLLSFAALLLTVTATTAVSAAEKITLIHSVPQLTSLFAFGVRFPSRWVFGKKKVSKLKLFQLQEGLRRRYSSLLGAEQRPPLRIPAAR